MLANAGRYFAVWEASANGHAETGRSLLLGLITSVLAISLGLDDALIQ